ncbi:hypothetical protein RND71_022564 [Anisodus tanguticus]|uniref:Pentatricopeptide repeat-containing protein n=1 Tax=Anisodus tanguticus TaxID=243964 RepID=A0AAE1RQX7_9SOLA|nr:hypothetical protein RND71_022564 [Anisodus tanguticus]
MKCRKETVTWKSMIRRYFQNGNVEKVVGNVEGAKEIFESMEHRYVVTWNSMITWNGNMDSTLLEFSNISNCDVNSWNSVICGLAYHGHGKRALEMFQQMSLTDECILVCKVEWWYGTLKILQLGSVIYPSSIALPLPSTCEFERLFCNLKVTVQTDIEI